MTAAFPVRHYLTEISGDSARQLSDAARVGRNAAADEQERLEDARMRGVMEGRAAADAEHGAALAAQKAAFEAKLAREREQWTAAEGARLAELFNAGLTDIEQKISDCVGRVLKPVVAADVRRAAVLSLSETLRSMVLKGAYAKINVSGPADLLSALEGLLGEARSAMAFHVAPGGVDLVVNADDTILETRIGAWVNALGGDAVSQDAARETGAARAEEDEGVFPSETTGEAT